MHSGKNFLIGPQADLGIFGMAVAKWSKAPDWELRSKVVGSNPQPRQQFFNSGLKKLQQGNLSQGNNNLQCPLTSMAGLLIKVLILN